MNSKKYDDDDGRRIADMSNTYGINYLGFFGIRRRLSGKKKKIAETSEPTIKEPPLTKRETRKIMFNALLGGLAIGSVFVVLAAIFILFCVFVWFK